MQVWSEYMNRADGRLRADEQPATMTGLPKPWPPMVGEPLVMVLELVPGMDTFRITSKVPETITLDHFPSSSP